jgi:proteic killer suppression protein
MLSGNRKGTWSLSVTANLRLTFRVEAARHAGAESTIRELNLEDYH